MSKNEIKVTCYRKPAIPEITPLAMGAPVLFFAPSIDVALERGCTRLKRHIQAKPKSEEWVAFGWMDGGLTSPFVKPVLGAFRKKDLRVEYGEFLEGKFVKCIAFEMAVKNDWNRVTTTAIELITKDISTNLQRSKAIFLKEMININPSR